MSIRTDVINLSVNINGSQSQDQLNQLRKRAADLKFEMEGLGKSTQEYADKKKELRQVQDQMATLRKEIGITALSQKELTAELTRLRSMRGAVTPFSQEYKNLTTQIEAVSNRLTEVRSGIQGFNSVFGQLQAQVRQFGPLAAAYIGFNFIKDNISAIVQNGAKMSDQLADIRRVAGLTAGEAERLNQQLTGLNTRTSTEGLRQIAVIAGKLGVAKQDLFSFTAAVDQLTVALGDELGNADQITTQLGKILNVFDKEGKVTGDNLLKAGNALVDLANKGVASGGFIVDFTQRLAGLAKTANLSLAASFGLGAGLEELGQSSESSSTAIIKIMGAIGQDVPRYAKLAGKSVEEFTRILRDSPQEALIQVSEALVKNKSGFDEISAAFDAVGQDGAKVVSTLSVIGGKADFMRSKITDAAGSLENTSEITDAFALKNETLGASLDKLGKEFTDLISSSAVTGFLQGAVNGALRFAGAIRSIPEIIEKNRTAFIVLTGAVLTYIAAKTRAMQISFLNSAQILIENVAFRVQYGLLIINETATKGLALAKDILTGKISVAAAAQRTFNAVLQSNPIGAAIVAVTTIAAAFSFFSTTVDQNTSSQKANAEVNKEVQRATQSTKEKLNDYIRVITSATASTDEKTKALEKLRNINRAYLGDLNLENIATEEGTKIIKRYIESVNQLAEAKALVNVKSKLQEQRFEKQSEASVALTELAKLMGKRDGSFSPVLESKIFFKQRDYDGKRDELTDIDNQINALDSTRQHQVENLRKQIATVAAEMKSLTKDSKLFKDRMLRKQELEAQLFTITGLADSNDLTSGPGSDAGNAVTASNGRTLATLKAQKKELEDAYEQIDVTNTKALKKNQEDRRKIQQEIDRIEGKQSPAQRKSDGEYERLKKDAEKFYRELQQLKDKTVRDGGSPEQREVDQAAAKYEELLRRAREYYTKHVIDKKQFDAEEKLIEEAKQQELNNIFQKFFKQRQEASFAKEYDESLASNQEFQDKRSIEAAQEFAAGKTNKVEYEALIRKIEADGTSDRITIAQEYAAHVKKAAEDLKTFKKQQEQKTTEDLIAETERRKQAEDNEALSKAQRAVITSKGKGIDAELEARKALLRKQFELETQYLDKRSEAYKTKEAELNAALAEENRQAMMAKIENVMQYVGFFQDSLNSLNQFLNNRENRQLNQEKKINDSKKRDLKKQFDDKLISQTQYDLKVQKLDEEQEKKEADVKRRQAKRDKALNLFNAVISNAAAIVKTMASVPFPLNIPLAIAQGIAGGLQVAAIASTPLPELGTGDWIRRGDKHSAPSRGIQVLIERDEAVMNAGAMTNPNIYTVTGTTAQITSALNTQAGNGVSWASGATLSQAAWATQRQPQIGAQIPRMLGQGGIALSSGTKSSESLDYSELFLALIKHQQETKAAIENMQTRLHAVVSIKEYRNEERKYDAAKAASSINA